LRAVLQASDLVDAEDRWKGGDAFLVQTGDLTDRGAEVRAVFDLLGRLQKEAESAGGKVITLLGNHEIYNLIGFFSPDSTDPEVFEELLARFADEKSEKRQRQALKEYLSWASRYPGCASVSKEEWVGAHPLGFVEYVEALAPDGIYGRWLREFPVAVRVGDTVFLHGGLGPKLEEWGFDTLEEINQRVLQEIELWDGGRAWLEANGVAVRTSTLAEVLCAIDSELFSRTENKEEGDDPEAPVDEAVLALRQVKDSMPSGGWLSSNPNGPLWFRGYAQWTPEEGEAELPALLERFDAKHFVVGHTPQPGEIKARFGGAVFLIDTALVFGEAVGGGPASLELKDGVFSALYPGERVALWDPVSGIIAPETETLAEELPWKDVDGKPLPFASPEQVEGFLKSASVVSIDDIPLGVTKPKQLVLELDGVRARAAFRYFYEEAQRKQLAGGAVLLFKDSYKNEVAAYELAHLLEMRQVPPTVLRTVDGVDGSVQIWIENTTMERDLVEADTKPPDPLRFRRQRYDMQIFDSLIGNFDRNQGNILWDEDWNMWLIDHTRAFRARKALAEPETIVRCSRPLWEGMKRLEPDQLEQALAPHLLSSEIRALIERRDRIIAILEERIGRVGEDRVLFDWGDPDSSVRVIQEMPEAADVVDPG
jgi:hypothetical protein